MKRAYKRREPAAKQHQKKVDDMAAATLTAGGGPALDRAAEQLSDEVWERETRPTRDQELREAEPFHEEWDEDWEPKGILDASLMPPREGYVQRWVRTMLGGQEDTINIAKMYRNFWRPRDPGTVPKGIYVPTLIRDGQGVIGMPGAILMERPAKIHEAQRRQIRSMTADQQTAVDNDLYRVHQPGSGFHRPTVKRKSSVTRGRRVDAAED
jgi:hypothetical protein